MINRNVYTGGSQPICVSNTKYLFYLCLFTKIILRDTLKVQIIISKYTN